MTMNESAAKTSNRKLFLTITAVVAAIAVVAGGVWGFLTFQRSQETGRWNDAAQTLAVSLEGAYVAEASIEQSLLGAEGVAVDEAILEAATSAGTELSEAITSTLADFDGVFVVHEALVDGLPAQSGAQSGQAQSGALETVQSGTVATPPRAVRVEEIIEVERTDEGAEAMLAAATNLDGLAEKALTESTNLDAEVARVLLEEAVAAYDGANSKLAEAITAAVTLIGDTEGKVADDATRQDLSRAVAAAQKVQAANQPVADTVEAINAQTQALNEATATLTAPSKAIDDSVAAKTEADRQAAEAAAASSSSGNSSSGGSYSGNSNSGGNTSGSSGGYKPGSGGWDGTIDVCAIVGGCEITGPICTEGNMMLDSFGNYTKCVGGRWVDVDAP